MKREEIVFAALAVGSYACCFAAGGLGAGLSRASSPWLLHLAFEAGFFAAAGILAALGAYLFLNLSGRPNWLPSGPTTDAAAKSVLAAVAVASRSPAIFAVPLLIANTALFQLLLHLHGR